MKNHRSLYVLAAFVLQSTVSLPVFADEVRHEERQADRAAAKSGDARESEVVNKVEGHPIRAELDAKHARHEEHRAIKHENRAIDHAIDR